MLAGSSSALVSIIQLLLINSKSSAFLKRGFSGVVSMFIRGRGVVNFAVIFAGFLLLSI
jgi:hypothetical protein